MHTITMGNKDCSSARARKNIACQIVEIKTNKHNKEANLKIASQQHTPILGCTPRALLKSVIENQSFKLTQKTFITITGGI